MEKSNTLGHKNETETNLMEVKNSFEKQNEPNSLRTPNKKS